MLDKIWQSKWQILALLAIWLGFECGISWAAFCDPQNYGGGYQLEEYNCIFRGPLASTLRVFTNLWRHFFHDAHAYVALFTAILSGFTLALWRSTDKLWTAGEKQIAVAEDQLKHAHRVERAYMSCGGTGAKKPMQMPPSPGLGPTQISVPTGKFAFQINNHGKTPGKLLQLSLEFCDIDNIPPVPLYNWIDHPDWIGPGTQSRTIDFIDLPTDRPHSCVYGRIRYHTIFDNRVRSSGFIQNMLENTDSFPIKSPSDAYTDWD